MGKRRRGNGIMDSIERDIAIQISMKEVEELLSDGKPHTLTFMDALFLDGQGLNTPVHEPLVFHAEVTGPDEFNEAFDRMIRGLQRVHRDCVYENLLATRAVARAGLVLVSEMLNGVKEPTPTYQRCMQVLATALTSRDEREFEASLLLNGEVKAMFQDFLNDFPYPDPIDPSKGADNAS